jgi:hypothetical protein
MENKQTPVEWLLTELTNETIWDDDQDVVWKIDIEKIPYLVSKAKQMEKEQIMNAHLTGLIYPLEIEATKQAEQYYNETYGK